MSENYGYMNLQDLRIPFHLKVRHAKDRPLNSVVRLSKNQQ
jgi:hypothetical protein